MARGVSLRRTAAAATLLSASTAGACAFPLDDVRAQGDAEALEGVAPEGAPSDAASSGVGVDDGRPPTDGPALESTPVEGAVFGDSGDAGDAADAGCPATRPLVHVLDSQNGLYDFDPATTTLTRVGTLACNDPGLPWSMAVDRFDRAWVVFSSGNLYEVDATTAACTATSFQPGQGGFNVFGMSFAATASAANGEDLYAFDTSYRLKDAAPGQVSKGLATIDVGSLGLARFGVDGGPLAGTGAELTGTFAGDLYGLFTPSGSPVYIGQISTTTGSFLFGKYQMPNITVTAAGAWAFAFASGAYWLFISSDGVARSTVYRYDPSDGGPPPAVVPDAGAIIVGAGVSICASAP
jgi:hypothetical protein